MRRPKVLLVCLVILFNSLSRRRGEFFDMSPFIMVVCTMSRKSVTQTKFCQEKKEGAGKFKKSNANQHFFVAFDDFIIIRNLSSFCHIFVYFCVIRLFYRNSRISSLIFFFSKQKIPFTLSIDQRVWPIADSIDFLLEISKKSRFRFSIF